MTHSCSTFLLSYDTTLLVGHNLDDYLEVPGLVVVNKRGLAKQNLSWDRLRVGPFIKEPKIEWVSRYGSITYNPMGKEFPDGGMNEAGLYIGEMTLFGTVYPVNPAKPKFYHQLWIQYLLDNFATVDEVLASLDRVLISGHCQWHFFIADRDGNSAIIEFQNGSSVIHRSGNNLPHAVLCNRSYERDLELMKQYDIFGGTLPLSFDSCDDDPRFAWAVDMLNRYPGSAQPAVEYAFSILKQLDCGNNRFSIVYNFKQPCIYFTTYKARTVRYAHFTSFDFSSNTPTFILDIHQPLFADVSSNFVHYTEQQNKENLRSCVTSINWGSWMLNNVWSRLFMHNILEGIQSFRPVTGP